MKKIITIILVLFLYSTITLAEETAVGSFMQNIPLKQHDPTRDTGNTHDKGPRIPARVPLTCFLMDYCLTVTCDYEAEGEVTVTNNATGMVVASETGELAAGIVLYLSDYTEGAMTVTITMNDKVYIGYF